MKNFFHILSFTWSRIFRDLKSFYTIAGIGIAISVFLLFLQNMLWGNYDFSTQEGVQLFFTETLSNTREILKVLFFIALSVAIPVLYDFFQKNSLASILQGKTIRFSNFFNGIQRFFPMIGTNICVFLYTCMYLIPAFILLVGLLVASLFMGGEALTNNEALMTALFAVVFVSITCISIWIIVMLIFTGAAFFIDDIRYFNAVRVSKNLVKNRWWKTLGMTFTAGVVFFVPMILMDILLQFISPSSIYGVNLLLELALISLRIFGAMMFFSFICVLYQDYTGVGKAVATKTRVAAKKTKKRIK